MKSTHVSQEKIKTVSELTGLIKDKKTILVASIKNIPSSQFQEIAKKFRGKAIVKVPKKSIIFRAIDSSGNEAVKKLKEQIKESTAILFSDIDSFELAAELTNKKTPSRAKAGHEAPFDIEIPAGPTDLVPGPAISELGALGIQIQIEKGKIHIKEPKIIARKGEKISAGAADILNKLDIKPFSVGFIPIAAFDSREGKIYTNISIDREKTIKELKSAFSKALGFAVEIGYTSKDTIKFLIGKAVMHEKALEKFVSSANESKDVNKQKSDEDINDKQDDSELKHNENSELSSEVNNKTQKQNSEETK